jgi:hypothetical protein
MDNELFELCKEVYERTGWVISRSDGGRWWMTDRGGDEPLLFTSDTGKTRNTPAWYDEHCPLYTSDYLLEKLSDLAVSLTRRFDQGSSNYWMACLELYGEVNGSFAYADTPLKALLKLTIALHEAGELKAGVRE